MGNSAAGRKRPDFVTGGGEMGARLRALDWSTTPLGDTANWPQSLRTAIRILLTSRFAMWMAWGEALTFFCNDAYLPTTGLRRDWVLGERSDKVWAEIWPDIGPRIQHVLATGEATWDEALLLYLERSGFAEETYHTFSYSPLADDDGDTVGMLCVVAEVTERVIGERQLDLLRQMGARLSAASTRRDVMEGVVAGLEAGAPDVPFALVYLNDATAKTAELCAVHGLEAGSPAAPREIDLQDPGARWGFAAAASAPQTVAPPDGVGSLPLRYWRQPPHQAVVAPIRASESGVPVGYFVAGLNPHRKVDAEYRGFIDLLTGQIAAAVARADEYESAHARAEALAEIDRAKTAFFSNVSHEFRTPLTLMLGPLEAALDEAGDEVAVRQNVEVAHRNGLRLLRLVNTLLDFSRIEAGRMQAAFRPTDLGETARELAASFRSAIDRAGLSLDIDIEPDLEPVWLDAGMIEKIVLNLLSNAFKFTLEGGIRVAVQTCSGGVEIAVSDTGVGIPADEMPRLFERFHQVQGVKGRSYEGSGIGLALVHELVQLHGGTIDVESREGVGTTFRVVFPSGSAHLPADQVVAGAGDATASAAVRSFVEEALRWLPDSPDAPGAPPPLAAGRGAGGRVLLADDNVDMRGYVVRVLSESGFEVTAVADGEAALDALREARPDLLLTDVMMPRLDGFGLLRAVRQDPALADLPVIMLSARAGEEAAIEGLAAGVDDYLIKPFAARELVARISANLALARARKEAGAALAARTAELEALLDTAPVAVWFTSDEDAGHTWHNRFADAVLRMPPGQTNHSLTGPPHQRPTHFQIRRHGAPVAAEALPLQRAARGEEVRDSEQEIIFDDGVRRSLVINASPLRAATGGVRGAVAVGLDITDRREAERAREAALAEITHLNADLERRVEERTGALAASNRDLVEQVRERRVAEEALGRAHRLEAVGQLTAGVAHDFNNLLTVLLGNLAFMERRLSDPTDLRRSAAMRQAAERGADLTRQLLAFSRRQRLHPHPVNLNDSIAGMLDILRSSVGGAVTLTTSFAPDLPPAHVDPNQFELVVLNLAINARDAMEKGGVLKITTGVAQRGGPTRPEEPPAGRYVVTSVSDQGVGMSEEVRAKALEPFFTTKAVGKGSGLGLAQAFGFAQQSGGGLTLESRPGEGTTVSVYLPISDAVLGEAAPDAPKARSERSGARVLVVDDDAGVREITVQLLADLGYGVVHVASGAEALSAIDSDPQIGLVVADYAMPGMNGSELAVAAALMRPELPFIFVTGYVGVDALSAAGTSEVIQKPFDVVALADKIELSLKRAGGAG